jgi:hypothetical protein
MLNVGSSVGRLGNLVAPIVTQKQQIFNTLCFSVMIGEEEQSRCMATSIR